MLLSGSAEALERTARRFVDLEHPDAWVAAGTATIAYYNVCTGWVWLWSDFLPHDRAGVVFSPGSQTSLWFSWCVTFSGVPSGYGFTGTIALHPASPDGCPLDPPIASQPFVPTIPYGWTANDWRDVAVPDPFALVVNVGAAGNNPIALASDRPGPTPGNPPACGTCFPTTRETHSYFWGPPTAPVCPGDPLFDGWCNAELMMSVQLAYPVSGQGSSWGKVKSLYR